MSTSADEIRERIAERFWRPAEQDGRGIQVELRDSRVVLEGTVHSDVEASEAEDLAWNVRGVIQMENRLRVARTTRPLRASNVIESGARSS
jgi:osmotically-inducible protein OsmY